MPQPHGEVDMEPRRLLAFADSGWVLLSVSSTKGTGTFQ